MEKKEITNTANNWFKNLGTKGYFITGIVLLIIIVLLSISILPNVTDKISSSLSAALYSIFVPAEKATMTANKKIINSGEDFNIVFKKIGESAGLFTVSHSCESNIDLFSIETDGQKIIDCDIPYYLLENETSIQLRSIITDNNNEIVRLVIDGNFENNDTQKTEKVGLIRVTVTNKPTDRSLVLPIDTSSSTTTSNTEGSTYVSSAGTTTASSAKTNYYGKPDLAIRILQIGLLNKYNNYIVSQNQFTYADTVGIKFEVRNDGETNTGPWFFTAFLPSVSTPLYNSNAQISLRPGESIIYTLGFDNLINQNISQITIQVDPRNFIAESIESNNVGISVIVNNSYNDNYYNNNSHYEDDLNVSCYAEPDDPEIGDRVRWFAEVSGGNEDYDYDWIGTNNLNSSAKNPSKIYNSRGTKKAVLTVESGGLIARTTCSVFVD